MNIRISKKSDQIPYYQRGVGIFWREEKGVALQSPISSSSSGYLVEVSGSSDSLIIEERAGNLVLSVSEKTFIRVKTKNFLQKMG
jgi:hypothetical protein